MRCAEQDPYITFTTKEEIEICEKCPYPTAQCGDRGCRHFRNAKREILERQRAAKEKAKNGDK